MNNKIRDTILFLITFTFVFNNIPIMLQMNFIGGPIGNKLAFYPLLMGIFYTLWCEYRQGSLLVEKKKFLKYVIVYLGVVWLSLIIGLLTYPYWSIVLSGPVEQIEKLSRVIVFLGEHGVNPDIKTMLGGWIIVRHIKLVLMEVLYGFGTAYMFFCWYKNDYKQGIRVACNGFIGSIILFTCYAFIDVFYLKGMEWAKDILVHFNPLIHPIVTNNGWWPPLLWTGQLRSVFCEPSYIGNFLGVAMPILLFVFMQNSKRSILFTCGVLIYLMSFFVVLSKARTAYAMYFGTIFLSVLMFLIGRKFVQKKIIATMLLCFVGFQSGVGFLDYISVTEHNNQVNEVRRNNSVTTEKLLEDNLFSLDSKNKRSNGARYALLKVNLRIFQENPMLGVGKGLAQCYMLDKYTKDEKENREVGDWINRTQKYGVFASGQGQPDAMNEWVSRLAETGIIGVCVFIAPFIFILYKLFQKYLVESKMDTGFLITTIIGSLVAGCNLSLNIFYGIWIFLGLGYAMCFGKTGDEKDTNERT